MATDEFAGNGSEMQADAAGERLFYIVDLRPEWRKQRYATVWRPDNAGYAWPLSWGGRYDLATIDANPNYYAAKAYSDTDCPRTRWQRFPVPCEVVDRLAVAPRPGDIDGDAGPVLLNDERTRNALRRARYVPAALRKAGGTDNG